MRQVLNSAAVVVLACALTTIACAPPPAADDPTPRTLEEFQSAAARVLRESGVPGAGIALVRAEGVDWVGGVGLADREAGTPVTADTHFRVGSISKTFVALALVQLYEEGDIDLEATIEEIAPDFPIENPWHATAPVRLIHLLQHTAGFDNTHVNELYIAPGAPELSLGDVLRRNPQSRRVRWPPGSRMGYSNPGYAVAGLLLEKVAGEPYEEVIKHKIFDPLEMSTSSFRLTEDDQQQMAQGYDSRDGAPVGFPRVYLRPAVNLHSSARELAQFVRMLLGWGELGTAFVVDPEYLSNMESSSTTLAASGGLRTGYGSGISATLDLPYRVLGHRGGIHGFASTFGYSPGRDVGYVILLNSSAAEADDAIGRLSTLALRYLKRDVAPPSPPTHRVDPNVLDGYVGYYHDASPANQLTWPLEWLVSGRTVVREGDELYTRPIVGTRRRLVAVTDTTFRFDHELDASMVFVHDEAGTLVLTGAGLYAERVPRARIEIVRLPIVVGLALVLSVLPVSVVWAVRIRRVRPKGFWTIKLLLLACPLTLLVPVLVLTQTSPTDWGVQNVASIAVYVSTLSIPALALMALAASWSATRQSAGRALILYASAVALSMAVLALYFGTHGLLGVRMWS